jgi:hypothetical protein
MKRYLNLKNIILALFISVLLIFITNQNAYADAAPSPELLVGVGIGLVIFGIVSVLAMVFFWWVAYKILKKIKKDSNKSDE